MITLCGFPVSNYYNKVKLALLEKGIPFVEERVMTGSHDEQVLAASPLAKIPFIRIDNDDGSGTLCESQVVLDYLEATHPQPPLLPADVLAAAKVRELVTFVDLHLELVARELYAAAFFGMPAPSEANRARIGALLTKNIAGFKRLAKFAPFAAGDTFTMADCSAWNHLPLVSMATKAVCGSDLLADGGIDWKPYVRFVGERPAAQRVAADRKAAQQSRQQQQQQQT